MLHQIVEIKRGKETVKMIDSLPKCNNRIKELRASYHGKKGISFRLEKSEADKKFEAKPAPGAYRGGDYAITPPVVK